MYSNEMKRSTSTKSIVGMSIVAIVTILLLIVIFTSWTTIDQGERGVVVRFGEVHRTLESGFHFKMPLVDKVVKMEVRTQKIETEATSASNDLQDVTTNVAIQFSLNGNQVGDIYGEYGSQIKSRLIDPAIQDAVKASTAKFNAAKLIQQRPEVKIEIENMLRERFESEYVTLQNVDIINFKFSDSFSTAIEEKVTAEQNAEREENRLRQVEFEAQQRIEQATAEAEAIRIQAQAITQQGGKDYVQLKAIEKWNGKLPNQFVPGSAVPFLNLNPASN